VPKVQAQAQEMPVESATKRKQDGIDTLVKGLKSDSLFSKP